MVNLDEDKNVLVQVVQALSEGIKSHGEIINRVNEINKRLIIVIGVIVTVFIACIVVRDWLYFRTDYTYPEYEQTQTNNQNVHINDKAGDK